MSPKTESQKNEKRTETAKTTMIITEKPTAAHRIAETLAQGKVEDIKEGDITYYLIERQGKRIITVPSVGHLYALKQVEGGWKYPVFNVEWQEAHSVHKSSRFSKKYLDSIKKLGTEADEFVGATDLDIEGEVILLNILRYACGVDDAKRMRFSTLTKVDLEKAYENTSPTIDWGLANAGLTRHVLDFYWGVNTSRALTSALNKAANLGFKILSAGRVQAPTLRILTRKEKEIRQFVPQLFWQIELQLEADSEKFTAQYVEDKIWNKEKADQILRDIEGKEAKVDRITTRRYKHHPPIPFDLTTLQVEAYRLFGYTPTRTTSVAQNLYSNGHISYPRTSSQQLPSTINYKEILQALSKLSKYKKLAEELLVEEKLVPKQGKKRDPAHPAIYPTTELPKELPRTHKKIFDLVCRRFMSVFAKPAVRETIRITICVDEYKFVTSGRRTIEKNWYKFYGPYAKFEEHILPKLEKDAKINVLEVELLEKETSPPDRYSPASIIKKLEQLNLGTKATRAEIVQTLFKRSYIEGRSIKVTKLGEGVVETLEKNCPSILSERLTKEFDEKMEAIREGKLKKEEVIEEAKEVLTKIMRNFRKKETEMGKELAKALKEAERARSRLGVCPNCGSHLKVVYSRKTRKRFCGCEGYPKCTVSFPLPQFGDIIPLNRECNECELPMITVRAKGRRPFNMCVNHKCPSKASWDKKKSSANP